MKMVRDLWHAFRSLPGEIMLGLDARAQMSRVRMVGLSSVDELIAAWQDAERRASSSRPIAVNIEHARSVDGDYMKGFDEGRIAERRRWRRAMSDDTRPTTERLAAALEAAGAPPDMIAKARDGYYDDYKSPRTFPKTELRNDARRHGLTGIVEGVLSGEWDATEAEVDAWAATFRDR